MGIVPFHRRGVSERFEYISPRLHMEIGPHYGRSNYFFEMQQDIANPYWGGWPTWKTTLELEAESLADILALISKHLGIQPVLFLDSNTTNPRTLNYEVAWLTEFCNVQPPHPVPGRGNIWARADPSSPDRVLPPQDGRHRPHPPLGDPHHMRPDFDQPRPRPFSVRWFLFWLILLLVSYAFAFTIGHAVGERSSYRPPARLPPSR